MSESVTRPKMMCGLNLNWRHDTFIGRRRHPSHAFHTQREGSVEYGHGKARRKLKRDVPLLSGKARR